MSFSNWNILILFVRTKNLLINLASLLLSMSKQVCIPAMLVLNTRCSPLTLTTLFCIAHVDILTRFSVISALSTTTISLVQSSWWQFLPGTTLFPILPIIRVFCAWHSIFSFHPYLYFSYLYMRSLPHGDLIYNNSSSVLALTISRSQYLSVSKGLFVVCAIAQSIQQAL